MDAAPKNLTRNIFIGLVAGIALGCITNFANNPSFSNVVQDIAQVGGTIFIAILKMLVVPIVFVSLVCGTCQMNDTRRFGRLALKTFCLYLLTTAIAISLALLVASLFKIGSHVEGVNLMSLGKPKIGNVPSLKDVLINIVPHNPFLAFVEGKMLQIIFFALLLGTAIARCGDAGKRIGDFFADLNTIVMRLILMLMRVAPLGVFCLLTSIFAKFGFDLVYKLLEYFLTVIVVLALHFVLTNSILLRVFARMNPLRFFRKMGPAMMFAFSTSSSNASIPVVLRTVEKRMGVAKKIASFTIPLGATINMDGTAIMQGVATVFIANLYHIPLSLTAYLTVILMATLASIGTAGVPGVGLITLTMVLSQVGLPVQGIALILGVDRLLDMLRTAVNITGDCAVSCVVARSEQALDQDVFSE